MAKAHEDVRDRIRTLLPGDEYKAQRNHLYSKPDFLKSNPTDEQIMAEAEFILPMEKLAEVKAQVGEIVPADLAPVAIRAEADRAVTGLVLPAKGQVVVVNTADDYQEADKGYASLKSIKAELESKRKKLKEPVLDLGRYIDGKFKDATALVDAEIARYEQPMLAFKTREREQLRAQETERLRLEAEAEKERQRLVREAEDSARAELEAAKEKLAEVEEDPFLAALMEGSVPAAREEVKEAMRNVALAPQRVVMPEVVMPNYVAPVTAVGSRTSYPWVVEVVNEGEVERIHCSPDPSKLNALGKYLKATLHGDITKVEPGKYPGLKIKEEIRLGGR